MSQEQDGVLRDLPLRVFIVGILARHRSCGVILSPDGADSRIARNLFILRDDGNLSKEGGRDNHPVGWVLVDLGKRVAYQRYFIIDGNEGKFTARFAARHPVAGTLIES
jgi:hypothetical protein